MFKKQNSEYIDTAQQSTQDRQQISVQRRMLHTLPTIGVLLLAPLIAIVLTLYVLEYPA